MSVIDVDTHWETTEFVRGTDPFEPWADRIPDHVDRLRWAMAGDALGALPPGRRPDARTLLPGLFRLAQERGGPVVLHPQHESTARERVAWMDRVGIDHCLVNPGGYWLNVRYLDRRDRARAWSRCNDYLAEELSDHGDRLHPVAVVDLADIDGAARELARARALGHRGFFLHTDDGRPPGGYSPGHPAWDRVWRAATDLGMVAVIHVGNTNADLGGWAEIGWDEPGGCGPENLVRLSNSQRVHIAENLLTARLYGGVFARFPTLSVVLEEVRVGWLPFFVRACARQSEPTTSFGDWPWDVSGADMLLRNVRFTPLPGFGDTDALDVAAEFPEMCLFSSDYPHKEGNPQPLELYGSALGALAPGLREAFLGGNAADCFARMGDPLPGPS